MAPPPVTTSMTLKRIHREIADLKKEDMGGMSLGPCGDSLFNWKASIPGPEGSLYDGGEFKLSLDLAPDYPFSAPKVTFLTRIYHMNISDRGGVCLDVLKHNWSPALSLYKVLLSLSSLLTDPNPKDPLVPSIANLYTRNRKQHDSVAREWTQLYAMPPKPVVPVSVIGVPNKGKGKATPLPEATSLDLTSSAQNQRTTQVRTGTIYDDDTVINIDSDSELDTDTGSEPGMRAARKRKRVNATGVKRKHGVDSDDTGGGMGRKKRNLGEGANEIESGSSGANDHVRTVEDVIVIED